MRNTALGAAILALLGGTLYFGAQPNPAQQRIQQIAEQQQRVYERTGKYGYMKGLDYEIHEYVSPTGEPGYQLIWQDEKGSHSVGYGPEAKERTFTIPNVASSTL